MNIIQIVAIDRFLGIGKNNNILFENRYDKKLFSSFTKEVCPVVICGRKTLESLPNQELKDRDIIVITRKQNYNTKYKVANSIENAMLFATQSDKYNGNIGIIGGGEIYEQFLPYSDMLLVTSYAVYDAEADAHYPKDFDLDYNKILDIPFPNDRVICNLSLYVNKKYKNRLDILNTFSGLSNIINDIIKSADKNDIPNYQYLL